MFSWPKHDRKSLCFSKILLPLEYYCVDLSCLCFKLSKQILLFLGLPFLIVFVCDFIHILIQMMLLNTEKFLAKVVWFYYNILWTY